MACGKGETGTSKAAEGLKRKLFSTVVFHRNRGQGFRESRGPSGVETTRMLGSIEHRDLRHQGVVEE